MFTLVKIDKITNNSITIIRNSNLYNSEFILFSNLIKIFYIMTSNSEKNKRARAPNISEEEKSIILHCISKERDIIECKKTDKFSNRDKNSAWERIAVNFNTHLGANKRDSKCLRRFWEVEKAKSRKGFARERREHMETGGGPEKESFNDSTPEINKI
ncbi:myb/SANT-like DNA-binding domain-containing protein 3 [Myzus persicae]|uniref:myb/SANT-like DNA-binding domain-containing protein 3 n=1 Tax=Myzus persicae TaxID=13164 RepID=UPI000B938EB8|nr:myb/SANT-like DNA-binding domain-containing protein 3 [Myzus persicae]